MRIGFFTLLILLLGSPVQAFLSMSLLTDPDFGILVGGSSGRQFILNTSGTITGANAADYVSGAEAGRLFVSDSSYPASISILADSISTSGGITVNQVLCSYDGGAQQQCDGGGMSVTSEISANLYLGVDISTSQVHSGGDTASITMDITISYL